MTMRAIDCDSSPEQSRATSEKLMQTAFAQSRGLQAMHTHARHRRQLKPPTVRTNTADGHTRLEVATPAQRELNYAPARSQFSAL